jgi:hypothetical protein
VSFHIDAKTARLTGDGLLTPQFRRSDASQGRYGTLYETCGLNVPEFTEPTRQSNVHAT